MRTDRIVAGFEGSTQKPHPGFRRGLLPRFAVVALAGLMGLMPHLASAQSADESYPSRPIRIVVPFAAGTSLDIIGRIYGKMLGEQLNGTAVVDLKPGGGAVLGTAYGARAAPDGYTLVLSTNSAFTIAPHLKKLDYTLKDSFVAVSPLFTTSSVLMVRQDFPANTLDEVVAIAKQAPGKVSYGSYGVGTIPHISMAMLESAQGITLNHIPYKGGSESGLAVASGSVDIGFETIVGAIARLKTGKVKPIAVLQAKRSLDLPDVPSTTELGYGDINIPGIIGVMVPAGTPPDIVKKLYDASEVIVNSPEFEEKVRSVGAERLEMSPDEMMAAMFSEQERIGKIVQEAGIKSQ